MPGQILRIICLLEKELLVELIRRYLLRSQFFSARYAARHAVTPMCSILLGKHRPRNIFEGQ